MRLSAFLIATVAAAAADASPLGPGMEGIHDVQVFRRHDPLSPRDLELAEMHAVNIEEMYKHTVFKRDDGDDVTIWVDNSFEEDSDIGLSEAVSDKRALKTEGGYHSNSKGRMCRHLTNWSGFTGSTSSTTGGPQEIVRWARGRKGAWPFRVLPASDIRKFRNLVVASTNGGANARIEARRTYGDLYGCVGTYDVADVAQGAMDRYQRNINGKWRVGASGRMTCEALPPQGLFSAFQYITWQLKRSEQRV